jgi:hypothetical protein
MNTNGTALKFFAIASMGALTLLTSVAAVADAGGANQGIKNVVDYKNPNGSGDFITRIDTTDGKTTVTHTDKNGKTEEMSSGNTSDYSNIGSENSGRSSDNSSNSNSGGGDANKRTAGRKAGKAAAIAPASKAKLHQQLTKRK